MRGLDRLGVPLLLVASVFESVGGSPARMQDVASVDEPASSNPLPETLVATGRLTTDDARVAHVYSPVTGRVTTVHVRQGQRVTKGDPLATIEAPDLDPTSDVYKAQADFIAAQHDYRRQMQLFAMGEPRRDLEEAADRLRQAKASLAIARSRVRPLYLLRIADPCPPYPCTYTIRSPLAGEVLLAGAVPGAFVQGQQGGAAAPELFVIGDLASVSLLVDVDEADLARVHVGSPVILRADALPGEVFEGTIDWVSQQVDPVLRSAKARGTLANRDGHLRPEMLGTVEIALGAEVR